MAMCTTGSLSIKATAGTCRDICAAVVAGGGSASGSLLSLSVSAGKGAPHSMLEFYGYNPVTTLTVNLTMDWYGNFNPTDGYGGFVRLRKSGAICCSTGISPYTKYREFTWSSLSSGTYCVDFSAAVAFCNGFQLPAYIYWSTDTTSGFADCTNTFSDNETVYAEVYPG